jgi:hypothetical protein
MSSLCDSSLEFDLYESMRLKLARLLSKSVGDEVRAGRVALYVMQGVREVPGLLNALASGETSEAETLALLDSVLSGAATLERARALLDDALADD